MMCSNCGKKEANFMYTEIVNGVKKEIRLCSDCANRLGFLDNMSFSMPSLDFSSFLGDFLNEYNTLMPSFFTEKEKVLKCSECGMDYDEFLRTGRFGCSNCYDVFQQEIEPLLKQLHGDTRFLGKRSNNNFDGEKLKNLETVEDAGNTKLEILKEKLKKAIRVEDYEKAAKLRDEIKELEGNNEKSNKKSSKLMDDEKKENKKDTENIKDENGGENKDKSSKQDEKESRNKGVSSKQDENNSKNEDISARREKNTGKDNDNEEEGEE